MKQVINRQKCSKCGGNIFLDHDYYIEGNVISWYEEETCLQCGCTYANQIPPKPVAEIATDRAINAREQLVAV